MEVRVSVNGSLVVSIPADRIEVLVCVACVNARCVCLSRITVYVRDFLGVVLL